MNNLTEANFDGACAPENPTGFMGIGVYINDGGQEIKYFEGFARNYKNTNNVAEYKAVNYLLRELQYKKNRVIIIKGDSNLVIEQLNGKWAIKGGNYKEEALQAKELLKKLKRNNIVTLKWIPREQNTIADELSKKGIAQAMEEQIINSIF